MDLILLSGLVVTVAAYIVTLFILRPIMIPYLIAKKRKMPMLILQTPTSAVVRVPYKKVHNLFHVSDTEVVVVTPYSLKSSNFGVPIGIGDYYCSIVAPEDVIQLFEKEMSEGVTIEEFNDKIYKIADDIIKTRGEPVANQKYKKFIVYKTIDYAKIKDFINIGLNPTLLNLQRKSGELTERLNAMKERNWMNIVIPIVILLIVAAVIWMLVTGGGGAQTMQHVSSAVGQAISGPQRIAP